MKSFIKPGEVVTYTAPGGGVTVDVPVLIGSILVIPTNTVAATLPFEGATKGVFTLPKATGAWTEGAPLFWDNTAKKITTADTSFLVGVAAAAQLSGDTTGLVRLNGIGSPEAASSGAGVQDIVLGTNAPDGQSPHLFVSTTGTVTGAVPDGQFVGQTLRVVQYVAATSPVGTLTGHFKNQAGTAKTTLGLGTATGDIGAFVWDGAAYRQVSALGGTGSSLT